MFGRSVILGCLVGLLAFPTWAQIPGGSEIQVNRTPIVGGTSGLCLYNTSTNKVGEQACGTGTAADITVGTTTVTGGSNGNVLGKAAGALSVFTTSGSGTVLALTAGPTFTTPTLGVATATSINGNTITTGTGTLTLGSVTLNAGAGGTLGSNAFTSTAYAPLASPTFSGTVTLPDSSTWGTSGVSGPSNVLSVVNSTNPQITKLYVNGNGATSAFLQLDQASGNARIFTNWTSGSGAPLILGAGTSHWGISTTGALSSVGGAGTIATAAPSGSSAGVWKLGALQTAAVVLDTTRSIFVDIGGVVYKLMVAQ